MAPEFTVEGIHHPTKNDAMGSRILQTGVGNAVVDHLVNHHILHLVVGHKVIVGNAYALVPDLTWDMNLATEDFQGFDSGKSMTRETAGEIAETRARMRHTDIGFGKFPIEILHITVPEEVY